VLWYEVGVLVAHALRQKKKPVRSSDLTGFLINLTFLIVAKLQAKLDFWLASACCETVLKLENRHPAQYFDRLVT
jgi:hypothetical protein